MVTSKLVFIDVHTPCYYFFNFISWYVLATSACLNRIGYQNVQQVCDGNSQGISPIPTTLPLSWWWIFHQCCCNAQTGSTHRLLQKHYLLDPYQIYHNFMDQDSEIMCNGILHFFVHPIKIMLTQCSLPITDNYAISLQANTFNI